MKIPQPDWSGFIGDSATTHLSSNLIGQACQVSLATTASPPLRPHDLALQYVETTHESVHCPIPNPRHRPSHSPPATANPIPPRHRQSHSFLPTPLVTVNPILPPLPPIHSSPHSRHRQFPPPSPFPPLPPVTSFPPSLHPPSLPPFFLQHVYCVPALTPMSYSSATRNRDIQA